MRSIFFIAFLLFMMLPFSAQAQHRAALPKEVSPLSRYSKEWDNAQYNVCNTARNAHYLTCNEKMVIWILNLARTNPKLFCKTVVSKASTISSFVDTSSAQYYLSLVAEMDTMKPLKLLYPDSLCFVSAKGHAVASGATGYVGHVRQNDESKKVTHFMGECCDYGSEDPLDIVLTLLIDQNVASLGHRRICLGNYKKMANSIQPHKNYGFVAVLDFYDYYY